MVCNNKKETSNNNICVTILQLSNDGHSFFNIYNWGCRQIQKKGEDNASFLFTSLFQLQLIGWHPILVFPLITSFWHYAFSSVVASFNQKYFVTVSQFFHFPRVFPLQNFWGAILDPMTVWGSWMWCWMCWM